MECAGQGAVGSSCKVVGYINPANMVERVETWLENPIFGDMLVESIYTEYREAANGVKYPASIVQRRGGASTFEAQILGANVNPANIKELVTRLRRRRPAVAAGLAVPVVPAPRRGTDLGEAGRGRLPHQRRLQRARGGVRRSHLPVRAGTAERGAVAGDHRRDEEGHSEQADSLRRDLASPLRSHEWTASGRCGRHHHRHASDQRGVLRARHGRAAHAGADAMSKSGKKLKIEGIAGDKRVFQDATRTVEVHQIKGLPHADGNLMVYLPKERILAYADMFNLPTAAAPVPNPPVTGTMVFLENIERLKLDPERIMSVHSLNPDRLTNVADIRASLGKK